MTHSLGVQLAFRCGGALLLLFFSLSPANGEEFILERSIELPKEDPPRYSVDDGARSFVVTYDLPTHEGKPVIVVATLRDVRYIDGETLEVLRHRGFGGDEYVTISQNGRFLAVYAGSKSEDDGKTRWKMRIEDWDGQKLWEMDWWPSNGAEPTPGGGFVTYTSSHPHETTGDAFGRDDHLPEPFLHPLLVYNQEGQCVLEGIGIDEHRTTMRFGAISSDGKHLAFLFRWIPMDLRHKRRFGLTDYQDKACVVLYDLEEGTEEWRQLLDGQKPRDLVFGPAERTLLCFVTKESTGGPRDEEHRVYSLDMEGKILFERVVCEDDDNWPIGGLTVSPDGKLWAVRTIRSDIYLMRTSDGALIHQWGGISDVYQHGPLAVDDTGRVFGSRYLKSPDSDLRKVKSVFDYGDRGSAELVEIDSVRVGRGLHIIPSIGSSTLWLKSERSLDLYRIIGDDSEKAQN